MLPILVVALLTILSLGQFSNGKPVAASASGVSTMTLDGADWTLSNANGTINVAATVPGANYLDLLNNQSKGPKIGDPYYRFNSRDSQWIAYEPYWTWTKTFKITDQSFNQQSHIELHFDGLDTIANVTLNNQMLGRSINQFRKVVYDVTGLLNLKSANQLIITIESPVLYGAMMESNYPIDLPVSDPDSELPHRNFIRKAQSDFGWDWGINLAPSGIWKSVNLIAFSDCLIEQITWSTLKQSDDDWIANVTVYIRSTQFAPVNGILNINLFGQSINQSIDQTISFPTLPNPFNGDRLFTQSVILSINQPALWWPRDYGQQPLYNLTVSFSPSQTIDQTIKPNSDDQSINQSNDQSIKQSINQPAVSFMSKMVAFRTIKIDRSKTPASSEGLSMTFVVNNQSIFIKGANLVPLDAFHACVDDDRITRLMQAAYDANMNLIRVWGGGIIQPNSLYDFADQFGILIWQEMLFACAQYPADEDFLNNAKEEVNQIARVISSHASLAVIGGNNENEAMFSWQPATEGYARDHFLVAYNELYVNTIREALVRTFDSNYIEYVASSPSNGPRTNTPYTLQWGDPQSLTMGDVHWYDYSADLAEVKSFPRPRFLSEFGAQSHTSFFSYLNVTSNADWSWNSDLMLFRQHHPDGNDQMMDQIAMHFNVANSTNTTLQFSDAIYLSQVSQSLSYTTGFHHWRRIQNEEGYCKGIVYWQLNDQWQAPTWASIEYNGRWKLTHYAVANAYEQLLISGYLTPYNLTMKDQSINQSNDQSLESLINQYNDGDFGVYAVNDAVAPQGGYLNVSLRHWATGDVVYSFNHSISVANTSATKIYGSSINQLLLDSNSTACVPRTNCWIHLTWYQPEDDQSTELSYDRLVSEFPVWLGRLKDAPLNNSQMSIDVEMEFIEVHPFDQSVDVSVDRLIDDDTQVVNQQHRHGRPIHQSIKQSNKQSINKPLSALDKQALRYASRYSNTPAIQESLKQSMSHSINQPSLLIRLHVQCHTPAAYVTFETPVDGRWDDNGLLCTPQTTGTYFTFYPEGSVLDHNYFRTTLNYYSLWDTYNRG